MRRRWVRIRSVTRGWAMKATMLRPAVAGFLEGGRHGLDLYGRRRGLPVGGRPAADAAGPVGVPAIVTLEHSNRLSNTVAQTV